MGSQSAEGEQMMGYEHCLDELETIYDELRKTNPQSAANLGAVIDRIEDGMALGPDHNQILSLYIG
jgi:exonuclease VII small subunit